MTATAPFSPRPDAVLVAMIAGVALVLGSDPTGLRAADEVAYRLPDQRVVDIVDAPSAPDASVDPDGTRILFAYDESLPTIERLSRPMLRLAGTRINPEVNQTWRSRGYRRFELLVVADGSTVPVQLPDDDAMLGRPQWSAEGQFIAFTRTTDEGVELWIAEAANGATRRLVTGIVNDTIGPAFQWWPGGNALLVNLVPHDRGATPARPRVPKGPVVRATSGRNATNRTYQDLLESPFDAALFEYYCTGQLARVDLTGLITPIGRPGLFADVDVSPDGQLLLVERIHQPFSFDVPYRQFARTIEVWGAFDDERGKVLHQVADLPVADAVPIQGVAEGPRSVEWQALESATLVWIEALDGGNPKTEAEHRDRLVRHVAPFEGDPVEVTRTAERCMGTRWVDLLGQAIVTEYDFDRRFLTVTLRNLSGPGAPVKPLFAYSSRDRYNDPGNPVTRTVTTGETVVEVDDGWIYLFGRGATPDGDRPFLNRFHLETGKTEPVFVSSADHYEWFEGFVQSGPSSDRALLIRRESPTEPPNTFVVPMRDEEPAPATAWRQLTSFPDPHPELTGVKKELVTYKRKDGVPLSGTLYLPPGYREGERLPVVISAYPLEHNDVATAGQVSAAPNRFTRLGGSSPLMFLTQGYAVLDNATMPVIGDSDTMNDTFLAQIVEAAGAAIDTLAERGVADRERVGVIGHSYGAFMVANLLAHSDLFQAGIARSGAYNRTLTPFGFQSERRTLWEARDTYVKVSPFLNAASLDEPILLIHGAIDNNSGTFPIQSERLFHALQGLGGTARLVMLPYESHGYSARESVLHVLAESFAWFDRYVKKPDVEEPRHEN